MRGRRIRVRGSGAGEQRQQRSGVRLAWSPARRRSERGEYSISEQDHWCEGSEQAPSLCGGCIRRGAASLPSAHSQSTRSVRQLLPVYPACCADPREGIARPRSYRCSREDVRLHVSPRLLMWLHAADRRFAIVGLMHPRCPQRQLKSKSLILEQSAHVVAGDREERMG